MLFRFIWVCVAQIKIVRPCRLQHFWNKRKNPTSKQSVSQTVNNKHNVKQHSIAPKTNTRNTEADGKEIQILHRRLLLSAYSEGERKDDTITRIVY